MLSFQGDAWSVPVVGSVLATVLAVLLPYKLNFAPPQALISWLTHCDFPVRSPDWTRERWRSHTTVVDANGNNQLISHMDTDAAEGGYDSGSASDSEDANDVVVDG